MVYPILPPFSCGIKKATTLLEQCVEESIVFLSHVDHLPSHVEQRDVKYCPFHRRRGHALEKCVLFRKIFVRSSRQVNICSKMKEFLAFMSVLTQTTTTTRQGTCIDGLYLERNIKGDVSM